MKLVPRDLESVAREYKGLLDQLKSVEQALLPYRTALEEATTAAGGTLEVGLYKISVTEATRESLSVNEAKTKLGKLLTPFIKITTFSILRVQERK